MLTINPAGVTLSGAKDLIPCVLPSKQKKRAYGTCFRCCYLAHYLSCCLETQQRFSRAPSFCGFRSKNFVNEIIACELQGFTDCHLCDRRRQLEVTWPRTLGLCLEVRLDSIFGIYGDCRLPVTLAASI
jgi:hypothetical protein